MGGSHLGELMLSLVLVHLEAGKLPVAEDPSVACWTDPLLALVRLVMGGFLHSPSLYCLKGLHLTVKRSVL